MEASHRALVVISDGCEEMEAVIAIDILRRAGIHVTVAGLDSDAPVTCSRKVVLVPDFALEQIDSNFDLLVIPGGLVHAKALQASKRIRTLLEEFHKDGKLIGIICASVIVLVGIEGFESYTVTSHPSVKDQLMNFKYSEDAVVVSNRLVTSRGPGTAFEFAFKLVEMACGIDVAESIKGPMMLL